MSVIEVTEAELAEYLGLSTRRIRQLFKEGIVIKSQRGKYDLKESVNKYISTLRDREKNKDENLEKLKVHKEAELLMHERLKKRKTELVVLQMEKKMHTSEDVEHFWNAMVMAAKSRLTSIPVKVAPSLVGLEDRKEIQSILKREVSDALSELANYDIEQFESEYADDEE
jgi:phage terminase Nu1 subunit (DNA packaging protein)